MVQSEPAANTAMHACKGFIIYTCNKLNSMISFYPSFRCRNHHEMAFDHVSSIKKQRKMGIVHKNGMKIVFSIEKQNTDLSIVFFAI